MRRVEELCRVAQARGIPRYTGFLSDREQVLAEASCHRAAFAAFRFWGGYPEAERRVLCLEPPQTWQEEPVVFLKMTAQGDDLPGHRDYLGAILGLGLDRACVGDILQDPQNAGVFYAAVLADKQERMTAPSVPKTRSGCTTRSSCRARICKTAAAGGYGLFSACGRGAGGDDAYLPRAGGRLYCGGPCGDQPSAAAGAPRGGLRPRYFYGAGRGAVPLDGNRREKPERPRVHILFPVLTRRAKGALLLCR